MKPNAIYSIIPDGDKKCIWMDAGVTGFKLCDLNFKCDTCEFNKEITQKQNTCQTPQHEKKSIIKLRRELGLLRVSLSTR